MDKQIEKVVEDQAKLLRAASQVAGISAKESWEDIGPSRQYRWMKLAKGMISTGNLVVPISFVISSGNLVRDILEEVVQRGNPIQFSDEMGSKIDELNEAMLKLIGQK